jgi:serine/threonine-protein kinase HipA
MASTVIEVWMWGTRIGFLGYKPGQTQTATFEYDADFIKSNVQISPLLMKYPPAIHSFSHISQHTFHGLPGVFADSLPDKFGNQLIDQYMAAEKIVNVTALDRLSYIGSRGLGALEYQPAQSTGEVMRGGVLELHHLSELADLVLRNKEVFAQKLLNASTKNEMLGIIRVGSSAGGARAKVLIATDDNGNIFDGTIEHDKEMKYWLLKLDVNSNSEHGSNDPKGMTRIEYIYSQFAKECGIDIPKTDYIIDGDEFHFMIERFDRFFTSKKLEKLHYVSWSGMKHYDRETTGVYSYEQLAMTIRELGLGQDALTELFRRAVFNIVGRNQDDHTKNFGFLMNKELVWSFSPAFDMTYAYDPTGKWTKSHQISLSGKRDHFNMDDLLVFGKFCNLSEVHAKEIIKKTLDVFRNFEKKAKEFDVPVQLMKTVMSNLRHEI